MSRYCGTCGALKRDHVRHVKPATFIERMMLGAAGRTTVTVTIRECPLVRVGEHGNGHGASRYRVVHTRKRAT